MKKKTSLAIVLALVLSLVAACLPLATAADSVELANGGVSVYNSNGAASTALRQDAENENVYYIDSAADLAFFVSKVNGGEKYTGKTIKLTTDIVWNEGDASTWTATTTGLNPWVPIGSWGKFLEGTFDGQGHTISGLWFYIQNENIGIFGSAQDTTIKNLKIVNSSLFADAGTKKGNFGFIGVNQGKDVTLENLYIDMDLTTMNTGIWYTGGLIGKVHNATGTVTIKNCEYAGKINAVGSYTGGFIGAMQPSANAKTIVIQDSLLSGTVFSSDKYVGGFLGGSAAAAAASTSMTITDSMVLGSVSASSGYGAVSSAQNMSNVAASSTNLWVLDTASAGTAEFSGQIKKTAAELAALTDASLAVNGFENWTMVAGKPMPKAVASLLSADVSFSATLAQEGKALAADEYTVGLYATDSTFAVAAGATALATAKNTSDGNVDLGKQTLAPGTTAYYVMKQVKGTDGNVTYDDSEYQITVTVSADGTATVSTVKKGAAAVTDIVFKNVYAVDAGALNLTASVAVSGRALKAEEFALEIWAAGSDFATTGTAPLQTVKNDAEGKVYFTNVVTYNTAGTYYYVVKQAASSVAGITADTAVYNVTVTVADVSGSLVATPSTVKVGASAPSEIVYTNTYKAAAGQLAVAASVGLTGRELAKDEFTVSLYTADAEFKAAENPILSGKNAADGSVTLGTLSFDTVGTYCFVLKQDSTSGAGLTLDSTVYQITVTVTDSGTGTLEVSAAAVKAGDTAPVTAYAFANSYKITVVPSNASIYNGTKSEKLRTESGVVYIDSAADLALFAEKVTSGTGYAGKTVKLTTDIIWNQGDASKWADGSETPANTWTCGAWSKWFQGSFDGDGHVISGLYASSASGNVGFLGAVSGKVSVSNLAIVNSVFTATGGSNVSGLIGVTNEGTKVTVDNCYVDAIVSAPKINSVGGFVGRVHNGACEVTITNSVFAGTVTGKDRVGGFIGIAEKNNKETGATITIENCSNMGNVSGNKQVSGFVGYNDIGTTNLTNCINTGIITGADAATTGALFGAGAAGTTLNVKDCAYVLGTAANASGTGLDSGFVVVAAASLMGANSSATLTKFDFKNTWRTVAGGYPLPTGIAKLVSASAAAERNPGTADSVPVAFATFALLTAAAAITVAAKKKADRA